VGKIREGIENQKDKNPPAKIWATHGRVEDLGYKM
jgi:hypothetical protein